MPPLQHWRRQHRHYAVQGGHDTLTENKLPTRSEDFNEWYNQLVLRAELADYAPVRGAMIVRPYGWSLWENIQQALDHRFKTHDPRLARGSLANPAELTRLASPAG